MKDKEFMALESKTVLKCENCDPYYELDKMNSGHWTGDILDEYYKNLVGMHIRMNAPQDYNEKLAMQICPFCNNKLTDTGLPSDDVHLIGEMSKWNRQLLDAMIELHKEDIVEYQLKLNELRLQKEQSDRIFEQQLEDARPRCPHCNSKNIKSISALDRGVSIAMLGIFSKKINKCFECKSCGYTW